MRVGVVGYLLNDSATYRGAGVSTYIRNLLEHLPAAGPRHQFFVLSSSHVEIDHVRTLLSPVARRGFAGRLLGEQVEAPIRSRIEHLDLLHGSVNVVPLATRTPRVVTVHDLAFMHHPERLSSRRRLYLRRSLSASVRASRAVITVSESTKRDLIDLLDTPPGKISVIYPGVHARFAPCRAEATMAFGQEKLKDRPYILHVGTLEPRKNLDVLIRAYSDLKREYKIPHALVLIGGLGWKYDSILDLIKSRALDNDVLMPGFVPSGELPRWYNGAELFAYPSVYEGFGLPVVEAMASGTPVVTSSSSSLVEVAGAACVTVEPGSVEALKTAMIQLLQNDNERHRLRVAGLDRARAFDWRETARLTVKLYESIR